MKPLNEFRARSPYYTSTPEVKPGTHDAIWSPWQHFYRGFDVAFIRDASVSVASELKKELHR